MTSANQIFISYRRDGGDVTAKLICEALKNRGYTVFYDFDALKGGFFDTRILSAIENCSDVVLVLPVGALDRCVNEDDWVRQELRHAVKCRKNIIPVMLNGFEFPSNLPTDIEIIGRYNGVRFMMEYFDAVMDKICERIVAKPGVYNQSFNQQSYNNQNQQSQQTYQNQQAYRNQQGQQGQYGQQFSGGNAPFVGKLTVKRRLQFNGVVRNVKISIDGVSAGTVGSGDEVSFSLKEGFHRLDFKIDWLKADVTINISPRHPESVVDVSFGGLMMNKLKAEIVK